LILLDTSIWVDLFRHSRSEISAQDYEDFVICSPVLQEVIQGLRDVPASEIFRQGLLKLNRLDDPLPVEAFLEAAEIYRSGRRRGYTIRSTVDCLIAAIAIRNGVTVWHKDRDYDTIARYTALRAVTRIR
jgi:predicted nucleic acid-binding protein